MEAIVQVMESTLGARDPYTVGHQRRVTQIACAIGAEMGLDPEQLRELRVASSLHDLGKVAVPLEILSKPGKLSDLEFSLVKTHPQTAYDILKPLSFPARINQTILQHHERLDGSGYPCALKGRDVSLGARILGVADVVEAMCSHRPYRPALGLDQALEELQRQRGKTYDADVVDICLNLYDGILSPSPDVLPELPRQPQTVSNHISDDIVSRNLAARWNHEKATDLWEWLRTFPFPSRAIMQYFAASLTAFFIILGSYSH